ncbi:beta-1,4-galactosyltransferase galt-1-like [Nematolebias whitei]|uniref:beta-1,4-galactosyltransferase galt-1-like n=1 Tax=Nematolebias whitei TaxID=451745 RepID=UPI00189B127D|nr:beta-1,4-galactosyltransferase galt-1-like [Nematolebias whitei]
MGQTNYFIKKVFIIITIFLLICLLIIKVRPPKADRSIPAPLGPLLVCPSKISDQTITPLKNTKHLLVSAFMDQRVIGFDIRIIGMFRRDSIQPLNCLFCCVGHLGGTTPTKILVHILYSGFPFVATDIMCQIPQNCDATHVTLLTEPRVENERNLTWIPIRNKKTNENNERMNFTVCISSLFGEYNNVLQYTQSLEMYRLLGVNRVVIYNTSCGPDLDRLLQSYTQEGFVEIVPWPINEHLNSSHGWHFSKHGGDIHYFGQLATLNECMYRYMERSRYVLLNDVDEIIMPYQHNNLMSLMDTLQNQHPDVGVFRIENHIFPKEHFEPSGRFHLPQWNGVPGVNILEHIYREDPDINRYHPLKLIVQPRMVEQTSVHLAVRRFGQQYKVPRDVCRVIHVRAPLQGSIKLEQLHVDKRLWDFQEKLIPNVDKVLKKVGMLASPPVNTSQE